MKKPNNPNPNGHNSNLYPNNLIVQACSWFQRWTLSQP